jgi:hypothetical protein
LASVAAPPSTRYGLAVIDAQSRLSHRAIFTALGWDPGVRIDAAEHAGVLVLRMHGHGVTRMAPEGHLRVPPKVRRLCGLSTGDRVLLAADPPLGRLVLFPPALLHELAAGRLRGLPGQVAP